MTCQTFQLEVFHQRSPFRFRIRHSHGNRSGNDGLVIRISSSRPGHEDGRIFGVGEALPRIYVTGETVESSIAQCSSLFAGLAVPVMTLATTQDCSREIIIEKLIEAWFSASSRNILAVWSAFDVALFDWLSKVLNIAPDQLLSEMQSRLSLQCGGASGPTGGLAWGLEKNPRRRATIPMIKPWLAAMLTFGFRVFGFEHFKVKVGDSRSARRVRAVVFFMGKASDLTLDANKGYTSVAAHRFLAQAFLLSPSLAARLIAFEDPVAPGDAPTLAEFSRTSEVPIMADEALSGHQSFDEFARNPEVGIWNIRIGKCGGITGSLAASVQARRAGARVIVGALVGEDRALTASARLLCAHVCGEWMENSFSNLLLKRSVFRLISGNSPRSVRRGLGLDLDEGVLRSQMISYKIMRCERLANM